MLPAYMQDVGLSPFSAEKDSRTITYEWVSVLFTPDGLLEIIIHACFSNITNRATHPPELKPIHPLDRYFSPVIINMWPIY